MYVSIPRFREPPAVRRKLNRPHEAWRPRRPSRRREARSASGRPLRAAISNSTTSSVSANFGHSPRTSAINASASSSGPFRASAPLQPQPPRSRRRPPRVHRRQNSQGCTGSRTGSLAAHQRNRVMLSPSARRMAAAARAGFRGCHHDLYHHLPIHDLNCCRRAWSIDRRDAIVPDHAA